MSQAAEDAKLAQSAAGGGGKKSKAGAAPPAQKPMFVEVTGNSEASVPRHLNVLNNFFKDTIGVSISQSVTLGMGYVKYWQPHRKSFLHHTLNNFCEIIQVCEQVVDAMKSGDPLPPSLLAKMIKYKVLKEKGAHRAAITQKVCMLQKPF